MQKLSAFCQKKASNLNSDSAFYIGKTHQVCQDYSSHGISKTGMPFAIISDGCSSSPDTDFGSRFLVKSCVNLFTNISGYYKSDHVLVEAEERSHDMGLPANAIDATLLTVQKLDAEVYSISCAGDGVIAKIKKDGQIDITQIEYTSGAPFYLSYQLSPERTELFKEKFGLKRVIKNYSIIDGKVVNLQTEEDEDGSIYFSEEKIRDYSVLAIMSDGILSFMEMVKTDTSKVSTPILPEKVIKEVLAFKNYNGVFVQRRLQRFRKYCEERNWFSTDDVSLGAIYLGE